MSFFYIFLGGEGSTLRCCLYTCVFEMEVAMSVCTLLSVPILDQDVVDYIDRDWKLLAQFFFRWEG